jgi:hypothetical protein
VGKDLRLGRGGYGSEILRDRLGKTLAFLGGWLAGLSFLAVRFGIWLWYGSVRFGSVCGWVCVGTAFTWFNSPFGVGPGWGVIILFLFMLEVQHQNVYAIYGM